MKKVFICSPYRGDIAGNVERAMGYCNRAIRAGCIPIAPHLYFTQFFDESDETERSLGITMGIDLMQHCCEMWVFGKPTEGMKKEIKACKHYYPHIKIIFMEA
jgi:hypothetical protein